MQPCSQARFSCKKVETVYKTRDPRATARATTDMQIYLMQHFFNLVIVTNEKIIIWAVLGFEKEECGFYYYFYSV